MENFQAGRWGWALSDDPNSLGASLRFALALRSGVTMSETHPDAEVALGVAGERRGFRWRRCQACGFEAMTSKDCGCFGVPGKVTRQRDGKRTVTPGCKGKLVEVAPMARPAHGQRQAEPVCRRTGCGRIGVMHTARGELVCVVCAVELEQFIGARTRQRPGPTSGALSELGR